MTREDLDLIARFCDGITHHYDEDRARIRALLTAYEATQAERAASPPDAVRALAEEVARLDAAATPRPWAQHEDVPCAIVAAQRPHLSLLGLDVDDMAIIMAEEDAALIARYRTLAPQLATSLLSVMAENEQLRAGLDEAAASLETVSVCNKPPAFGWPDDDWAEMRLWSRNRALAARKALAKQEDSPDGR